MGTAAGYVALGAHAILTSGDRPALLLLAGSAAYLAGAIAVTALWNVPLNDTLALAEPGGPAAGQWATYAPRWSAANHARPPARSRRRRFSSAPSAADLDPPGPRLCGLGRAPCGCHDLRVQLSPSYPVLTPRLVLRPLVAADVEELLDYRARPEVCRYLPFAPMTGEVLQARLAGDMGRTAITQEGQAVTLGAWAKDSGRLLGDVVLFFHSREHASGESATSSTPTPAAAGTPRRPARPCWPWPSTSWACTG